MNDRDTSRLGTSTILPRLRRARAGVRGLGFGALVVALTAACGSAPLPSTYSLPEIEPTRPLARPALDGVLMVERPFTDSVLSSRRLSWRDAADPLEIKQYDLHLWNDPPNRIVQLQLRACLATGRAAAAVTLPTDPVPADYLLGGALTRMEQVRTAADRAEIRLAAELTLSVRQSRDRIWSRPFEVVAPALDDSPKAAIAAFETALGRLCDQVLIALAETPTAQLRTSP